MPRSARSIDFRSRALPLIDIHFGSPTDTDIPRHDVPAWIVECLSCWGAGDVAQYLGGFPSERAAIHHGDLHRHVGNLGLGL